MALVSVQRYAIAECVVCIRMGAHLPLALRCCRKGERQTSLGRVKLLDTVSIWIFKWS
jgi:hypothetical protein